MYKLSCVTNIVDVYIKKKHSLIEFNIDVIDRKRNANPAEVANKPAKLK